MYREPCVCRAIAGCHRGDADSGGPVTASFGVTTFTAETVNPAELVSEADKALYCSKKIGRNCVTHFQDLTTLIPDESAILDKAKGEDMASAAAVVEIAQTAEERSLRTYNSTIEGWSRLLDLRDKETEGHSERVTEMTYVWHVALD